MLLSGYLQDDSSPTMADPSPFRHAFSAAGANEEDERQHKSHNGESWK